MSTATKVYLFTDAGGKELISALLYDSKGQFIEPIINGELNNVYLNKTIEPNMITNKICLKCNCYNEETPCGCAPPSV